MSAQTTGISKGLLAAALIAVLCLSVVASYALSLAIGLKGEQGPAGPTGATGATGATGQAGTTGATGAAGATGPAGADGATWLSGSGVPAPGLGNNGDYYLDVVNHDIYSKAAGAWTKLFNIAAGANGALWFSGSGVPASSLGNNGDYYLDTATSDVYNKASGSWTKVANIKGATGATGATGPTGPTGATGPAGPQGEQGPPGVSIVVYNNVGDSMDIPTSNRNLGSVTLNIPATGYVHLVLTGTAAIYAEGVTVTFGLGSTSGSMGLASTAVGTTEGSGGLLRQYSLACQAVVYITTPGSYTFYATAKKTMITGSATVNIYGIYLTALFCGT